MTCAWDANTEPDLAGYHIRFVPQGRAYTNVAAVGKVTSARVDGLEVGSTYYLAISAFNSAGRESPWSAEITYRVPINLAPTLDPVGNVGLNEDPGMQAVYLSGITAGGTESQTLTVRATSSNPALVPAPRLFYRAPNNYGWLVYEVLANSYGSSTISVTVDDGQAENNTITRTFTVTVAPRNDPPVISGVPNQLMREDTPSTPFTFTVSDTESAASELVVTARSSNPMLIPNEYVLLAGTGSQRDILIVPQLDQSGTANITLEVRDPQGGSSATTFSVEVADMNDDPVISPIADQIVNEDTPSNVLPFYIFDSESGPDELTLFALSSNQQLIPDENIVVTGTGNARSLVFTPARDAHGNCQIDLWVIDPDGYYSATQFQVQVRPLNDSPTIAAVPNQVLSEDMSGPVLQINITDVETTAGELTLTASSSNPSVVPDANLLLGGTGDKRTLTITPRPNQFGNAVVLLTVGDLNGGSASTSFNVTVLPVNDPPAMDPIPNLTLDENSGPLTVPLFGIHSGAPNELQPLVVTAASSRPDIISSPQVNYVSPENMGSLLITPLPLASGTAVITVSVSDGQAINGVTTRAFNVAVRPFNNPPIISGLPDLTVVRIPVPQVVSFTVQDPDTSANNLVVTGYSSDPLLLPNANLVFGGTGTQRTLTINPVAGRTGLAVVTIVASDGDATISSSFYVLVTSSDV